MIYAAAKGFIATATKGWAKELVEDGIRVNAVSPGVILTPSHERFSTPAQLETMRGTVPMGWLGNPRIASAHSSISPRSRGAATSPARSSR